MTEGSTETQPIAGSGACNCQNALPHFLTLVVEVHDIVHVHVCVCTLCGMLKWVWF